MHKINKGFTLFEMIVVVAILIILTSIALINYSWNIWLSKNAKKIYNVTLVNKTLENEIVNTNKAIVPDNNFSISYNQKPLYFQWVLPEISNLSLKNSQEYWYILSSDKKNYNIYTYLDEDEKFYMLNDKVWFIYDENSLNFLTWSNNIELSNTWSFDYYFDWVNYNLNNNEFLWFLLHNKIDNKENTFNFNCEYLDPIWATIWEIRYCVYDNDVYKIKLMPDNKWWFLDNLNTWKFSKSTDTLDFTIANKFCYKDDENFCNKYCKIDANGTFIDENDCVDYPKDWYVKVWWYYKRISLMWFWEECNIDNNTLITTECVWKAKINHQWICPKNWHVASDEDFKVLEDTLFLSNCRTFYDAYGKFNTNSWWECPWLWWSWNKLWGLVNILSWWFNTSNIFVDGWTHGHFFTYSVQSSHIRRFFYKTQVNIFRNAPNRPNSFNARCVKN